ncbi:MAG: hypothetical protein ACLFV7_06845 [Phycisphaerae bacterium]
MLFGRKAGTHRLLADHLTAEYRVKTEARERTVDEWELRTSRPDNHWLDCRVGAAQTEAGIAKTRPAKVKNGQGIYITDNSVTSTTSHCRAPHTRWDESAAPSGKSSSRGVLAPSRSMEDAADEGVGREDHVGVWQERSDVKSGIVWAVLT